MFAAAAQTMGEIQRDLEALPADDAAGRKQLIQKLNEAGKLAKWAVKSQSAKMLAYMTDLARSEPGIPVTPDQLDVNPWLLNCPNGTIDLKAGTLRPHDPDDQITQLCPTEYDADATCPTFLRFLDTIFPATGDAAEDAGDAAMIQYVRRALGRCLTGDVSEQMIELYVGVGANGKGTLLNTILRILGTDYATTSPPDLLIAGSGARHPTELMELFRKRLIVGTETGKEGRLNEERIKALTGGDMVKGRRMREDFSGFMPTHKFVVMTNHRPVIADTDDGIWRRVRLVPFSVRFWDPDEVPQNGECRPECLRQDKTLPAKLMAEAPGILNWLVGGCLEWQREGLGTPTDVMRATAEYRAEQDIIAAFIEDRCAVGSGFRVKSSVLYEHYVEWAKKTAAVAISRIDFGERMGKKYERQTSNGTWYLGVMLRS
jgi:putative DNA primase/helicase